MWDCGCVHADVYYIDDLSVFLTEFSDMPTIHALAKAMAGCFLDISHLSLRFELPCEIVSFSLAVDYYYRN